MTVATRRPAPLRGLTWDHPRGTDALRAAAADVAPIDAHLSVTWDAQPLEGFESAPIGDLAERYVLLVLDHPHLGDALAEGALQPLDAVLPREFLADLAAHSVGPSYTSYSAEGHQWALPLDAAAQVQAVRSDVFSAPPETWNEVLALSRQAPVALSLAGPHAFLSLCSLVVSIGPEPRSLPPLPTQSELADTRPLFDREAAAQALILMNEIARRAPAGTETLNPIGLLDRMRDSQDIACIPLIYGYVNYAATTLGESRVSFVDAPSIARHSRPGSTIGGTGIALSARAEVSPELVQHLMWLLSAETQGQFIPQHAGQPSRDSAWESSEVDAAFGGFYRRTRRTLDDSWVRPRFAGYTAFQSEASAIVRDGLAATDFAPQRVVDALESAYRGACDRAAHLLTHSEGALR